MKNVFILLMLILCSLIRVSAQKPVAEWTFHATYQENAIELDSVYIENVTENCHTTIYAPVTSFSVNYSGVDDLDWMGQRSSGFGRIYPNPTGNETKLELYVEKESEVTLEVSGLSGKIFHRQNVLLSSGTHLFKFIPATEPVYLVTARSIGMASSARIFSVPGNRGVNCTLKYSGKKDDVPGLKSNSETTEFIFKPGDEIKFIGYVHINGQITGSQFIIESVSGSKTYTFIILPGKVCQSAPFVEYEGKNYSTVQLGNYCWFRENIAVGEIMTPGTNDMTDNGTIERYCYNDDPANCDLYGGLYQWSEAMQYTETSGARGICPQGWHIPTTMEFYLTALSYGGWVEAGGKMKSTDFWASPNTGATNETGFTALPGGMRVQPTTPFGDIFNMAYFWSSDGQAASSIDSYWLMATSAAMSHYNSTNQYGMSVRCIKDY